MLLASDNLSFRSTTTKTTALKQHVDVDTSGITALTHNVVITVSAVVDPVCRCHLAYFLEFLPRSAFQRVHDVHNAYSIYTYSIRCSAHA